MVKVTLRRVRAGLLGASGFALVGTGATGCAATPGDSETTATTERALNTAAAAGTGTLSLCCTYGTSTYTFLLSQSSTDEFIRVGEKMAAQFDGVTIWELLNAPNGAPYPATAYVEKLEVSLTVQFLHGADVLSSKTLASTATADAYGDVTFTTKSFVIPASTDALAFSMAIVDPGNDNHRVDIAEVAFATIPVFGGDYPLKHAIFDNDGNTLRQRIIEGGGLVEGTSSDVTYTDWRADEIVQRTSLDLQIGTAKVESRFGPTDMPIYGTLQYEISYGFSFDGSSWEGESALTATTTSRVLDLAGRTAYEGQIWVPSNASGVFLYFHVKAYLVVDYTPWGSSVDNRRYNQGDRILLSERWDNPNGPDTNYELPVEPELAQ